MIEHRVIERMIKFMKNELEKINRKNKLDAAFIDDVLDFIKTYADLCHHGKEEYILFRDLLKKNLSPGHRKMVDELIREHIYGRKTTKKLATAQEKYRQGDRNALKAVAGSLKKLVEFYPKHIEKEDKHFFLPSMGYFSKEEQACMLRDFAEFDRRLIHEKYKVMVERLEKCF
ncbi:MAG: hemerythrin domain-containing protein [Candidatus Omnitrophica bacterium]|nr:hemerythrin domain-containing protein [Candidatus Omnitrophota bacterium]